MVVRNIYLHKYINNEKQKLTKSKNSYNIKTRYISSRSANSLKLDIHTIKRSRQAIVIQSLHTINALFLNM